MGGAVSLMPLYALTEWTGRTSPFFTHTRRRSVGMKQLVHSVGTCKVRKCPSLIFSTKE